MVSAESVSGCGEEKVGRGKGRDCCGKRGIPLVASWGRTVRVPSSLPTWFQSQRISEIISCLQQRWTFVACMCWGED